jgi:hypothetical protein
MAIINPYYNSRIYPDKYYQQEPREYAEERFRKKYELHVEKSKRHYRHKSAPISYRDWYQNGGSIPLNVEYEREPLLKVYVSQEHYDALVERERYLETVEQENRELSRVREDQFQEAMIRNRNPAVKQAYEKYKMLLELVR